MKKVTFTKRSTRLLPAIAAVLALLATLMVASPVLAAPLITLSPSAGAAGTQVTVAGISFESYRGDSLHVFFDNTEVPGSPLVVPEDGTFSFPFHVAADASPGNHTVRVKNEAGSTLALGNFTVPTTGISLNITMGGVGSAVTVRGQGFYSGQAVNIYY